MIRLALPLDLERVAEGVETADRVNALRARGLQLAQGFHSARPMPLPEPLDGLAKMKLQEGPASP